MDRIAGQLRRRLKEDEERQRRFQAQQDREDTRSAEERQRLIARLKAQSEKDLRQAEKTAADLKDHEPAESGSGPRRIARLIRTGAC